MNPKIKNVIKKTFFLEYIRKVNFVKRITKEFKLARIKNKKCIILLNTCGHSNLGDQAIDIAEIQFLCKFLSAFTVISITHNEFYQYNYIVNKFALIDDLIIIHGGGFLGTLWESQQKIVLKILNQYRNNNIIIFPQTVYFDDNVHGKKEQYIFENAIKKCKNITIFAREMNSYEFLINNKIITTEKCFLVPDIVTYLNLNITNNTRENILYCMRKDKEKINNFNADSLKKHIFNLNIKIDNIDMYGKSAKNIYEKEKGVLKHLNIFASYELVITDRLHGMLFATLAGTPCIVFDNVSKKVSGVYDAWLKHLPYVKCIKNDETLDLSIIKNLLKTSNNIYNNDYLSDRFDIIANVCKEYLKY